MIKFFKVCAYVHARAWCRYCDKECQKFHWNLGARYHCGSVNGKLKYEHGKKHRHQCKLFQNWRAESLHEERKNKRAQRRSRRDAGLKAEEQHEE